MNISKDSQRPPRPNIKKMETMDIYIQLGVILETLGSSSIKKGQTVDM